MIFNLRTTAALAVSLAVVLSSASAWALKVPEAPEYTERTDPHTTGGERVGADEDFDGYPADPGKPGDLYHDTTTEYRAHSPSWTGASYGFGIMGGAGIMYGQPFDKKSVAPTFGAFAQISTLLGIADGILSFTRGGFNSAMEGTEVDVVRWDIAATATIHPGLFFNLSGGRLSQTIAQFHFLAGGNLTIQTAKGGEFDSRMVRPGFHLGAGIDTPIDTPHDGSAFWIGVQYRWMNTAGSLNDDHFRYKWTREHQILLRLSFRINGSPFKQSVPGPSAR